MINLSIHQLEIELYHILDSTTVIQMFYFPSIKNIVNPRGWQIVSYTEGHCFDHVVLTLESQNNISCAEMYSVSHRTTYFSKTLTQEQHTILGTSEYYSFNTNSVKSLHFWYGQSCDLQSHHSNS